MPTRSLWGVEAAPVSFAAAHAGRRPLRALPQESSTESLNLGGCFLCKKMYMAAKKNKAGLYKLIQIPCLITPDFALNFSPFFADDTISMNMIFIRSVPCTRSAKR
jgi:hypothetical protein